MFLSTYTGLKVEMVNLLRVDDLISSVKGKNLPRRAYPLKFERIFGIFISLARLGSSVG